MPGQSCSGLTVTTKSNRFECDEHNSAVQYLSCPSDCPLPSSLLLARSLTLLELGNVLMLPMPELELGRRRATGLNRCG